MRNATRNAVTVVGLGVLGVSYSIGAAAQTSGTFNSTTIGINGSNATAAAQAAAAAGNNTGTTSSDGTATNTGGTGATTQGSGTSSSGSGKTQTGNSGSSSSTGSASNSASNSGSNSGSAATSAPAPAATATAAPAATPTPTKTTAPVVAITKTGSTINYRFGVIQVSVTKESGKITAVNLVQGTATHGRESAFPYLQQFAVQAQGSGFANMSGATYTTDAFKQAVDSALSKF